MAGPWELLVGPTDGYIRWSGDTHPEVRRSEVESHLDEFSWYGGTGDEDAERWRPRGSDLLGQHHQHFDHSHGHHRPTKIG